jgi:polysaccharide export outer membrane protein
VITVTQRLTQGVTLFAALALVASCGLPRSGPTRDEIFSGSVMREGDAFVLTVDDRVNTIASVTPALGFSDGFLSAGVVGSDTIQPGDLLTVAIWENVDDGLLVPTGENATVLEEVQVDGQGFIFVPYAGRIRAAGNPPEAVRRVITEQLQEQTPDPQVQVSRLAGDGATVSVAGAVGAQGVYPIERPTRTLSAMLAAAGGLTIEPEIAQITIVRGGQQDTVWFQDLYDHPANDIALRGGDRIVVEEDTRSFTALGATLTQSRVPFESQTISAVEAIAQVGGLSSLFADPTGVFVFRNEPEAIARQLVGDPNLIGDQRVIYVLDLTRPNGVFLARDFAIRDGDTVYVTEAPYTQFAKVLSALTGSLVSIDTATASFGGI